MVPNFANLASVLRTIVSELCTPSVTVRKFAQSATTGDFVASPNWLMTGTPTVTGGTFDWILPTTPGTTSRTVGTDTNGYATFQWEPNPSTANSSLSISEQIEPGYAAGRPGQNNDWECEVRTPDSDTPVRTPKGDFGATPTFSVDVGQETSSLVPCTTADSTTCSW